MEEQLNPLAVTHLLQHTLRSLCIHETSQWVYAVFWRILPRNYPPPRWDLQGGAYDRTRGNRRNWILVWEDGFCNFAASACGQAMVESARSSLQTGQPPPAYAECDLKGLQPELFFKMSHEIYNYGEGLIGKVAADHSHKWVFKEPQDQEINLLSSWSNPADSQPRTWEAQFQAGIKTIALIAVREGVVQLGAVNKVAEDLSFVVLLRKKFHYLESIPGVLLPHPSSAAFPVRMDGCNGVESWPVHVAAALMPAAPPTEFYDQFNQHVRITPSMSSLEALLSNLPSIGGPSMASGSSAGPGYYEMPALLMPALQQPPMVLESRMAKEEVEEYNEDESAMKLQGRGECSSGSSMSYAVNGTKPSEGF